MTPKGVEHAVGPPPQLSLAFVMNAVTPKGVEHTSPPC
ncbi:hypothetical protein FRUB_10161 [Fimbriiglobus ruber]|uniref:Uncharacterized protein n=1 Tax=Fimbriiglobus ruber TaxID=1908690 RepID=A0A225CXU4_9BACT|nr:hypothetical protein FRUB_10161 [Fimbriiglobus ruber]